MHTLTLEECMSSCLVCVDFVHSQHEGAKARGTDVQHPQRCLDFAVAAHFGNSCRRGHFQKVLKELQAEGWMYVLQQGQTWSLYML
jgi:hypothetical protein